MTSGSKHQPARSYRDSIVGVLLAAGLGTRYDPSGEVLKLLQPMPNSGHAGLPLIASATRNLKAAVDRTIAVVRARDHAHQFQLHTLLQQEGCDLVVCERAADGMGFSLACGVQQSEDAAAWIVALGDMPAISPATIGAIAGALRAGHPTVAPVHQGRRGHPVGFSAACRSELLRLEGDHGARTVLEKFPPHLVEVDDEGILLDVDLR